MVPYSLVAFGIPEEDFLSFLQFLRLARRLLLSKYDDDDVNLHYYHHLRPRTSLYFRRESLGSQRSKWLKAKSGRDINFMRKERTRLLATTSDIRFYKEYTGIFEGYVPSIYV